LYRNVLAATRLTRSGKLVEATALIREALNQGQSSAQNRNTNSHRDPAFADVRISQLKATIAEPSVEPIATRQFSRPLPREQRGRFMSLCFDGQEGRRAYKLFIPSGYYGQPCPLIVMLHGCTQNPDDFAAGTQMNSHAEERTFFVVYPEQPSSANASRCWNWFNPQHQQRGRGEPSIVAKITRHIVKQYAIDDKRIYVAGMSAGAAAAAVLGSRYPDLYAAVGIHSGLTCGIAYDVPSALAAMRNGDGAATKRVERPTSEHARPRPTIVFHGDADGTVHSRNGDRFAEELVGTDYEKRVETGRGAGGRPYTRTIITDQTGSRVFEQWLIHGAGHAWSGGSAKGSYTDPLGPNASHELVRFFLSHRNAD
jgi:poly(hydroxyalkanoate) depolymerase family esterase